VWGAPVTRMIGRHVGRLGNHGFLLRLGPPDPAQGSGTAAASRYWEIEYEGRVYPWRPVHPDDEADVPRLMRTAMAYLRGELQRRG
jgi:hypothetical protein